MPDIRDYQTRTMNAAGVRTDADIDQGLRSYMLKVYNLMALGVALTGLVAYFIAEAATSNPAFAATLYNSPLKWVVLLAPLAPVLFLSFGIERISVFTAQLLFWVYAALVGLSISSIFLVYTNASIVQTFAVTAASFAALSLFGYTTKRDLSAMGSFLMMGLFGLIIASVVNIFLGSSALEFAISVIGVLIFAGLTAYDTQRIKEMYFESAGFEAVNKMAIMGALTLYMDFINLFLFLLRFMGNKE